MMLFGILAGAAAYVALKYLKSPKHQRCPAGRRKHARKVQAEARRKLRDPKHRGDRASHRAARRLLKLTRKHNPSKPRYREMTPEEMERSDREMNALLARWTEEAKEKAKAEAIARGDKVVYEDSDSIFTETP